MAEGTKLVLEFQDANGKNIFFMFNYAKPSTSLANINSLMQAIINNGSIFKRVPVTAKSAKTVTTSENTYDIS